MWGDKLQALELTLVTTENPISTTIVSIHNAKRHSRRSNSIDQGRNVEFPKIRTNQKLRTQPTYEIKVSQGTWMRGGGIHLRQHQRKAEPSERLDTVFAHERFGLATSR
jgi:hypothetical protein